MPSAGELLRYERETRNRTLSEIALETCISTRYLQAIEADDPKILPGDFFHRSFIRQYADCLKLDCATTKAILDAVEPAPERLGPTLAGTCDDASPSSWPPYSSPGPGPENTCAER